MSSPTLHEIAAMPYPESMLTMRRHYNQHWGKYSPAEGELATYKVRVNYSARVSESRTYTVEAYSEDEAKDLSEDMFNADRSVERDAEVEDVEVLA